MLKSDSLFYLLGLICGKGYILDAGVSINFPHKNRIVEGIAYCPKCGDLASKPKGSKENFLKCKNKICKDLAEKISPSVKKQYPQREMFYKSISESVIPFLKKKLNFEFDILSNSTITIINIFKLEKKILNYIKVFFNYKTGFDRFEIPKTLNKENDNLKIEFINGLMDSAGTPSAGGWLNRDGKNGHGRMRSYFQIVRNWKIPVQIDNFLRDNFNIPTQKFDWGHPNIRDPQLNDYINHSEGSFARECQIGFFPENFKIFKHRISPKKELFNELLEHNLKVGFDNNGDWLLTKKKIAEHKIKPNHPMEKDYRIPEELRYHFDAEWQINLKLGCKYLKKQQLEAKNKDVFALSGDMDSDELEKIKKEFNKASKEKFEAINIFKKKSNEINKDSQKIKEQETYEPLVLWLKKYIKKKYNEESEAFDTSSQTLNRYFSTNFNDFKIFEDQIKNLEDLDIRPDVVGISKKTKKLFFIESKVVSLGIKEIGQIWAYSVIAEPYESFLISTKDTSLSLMKVISQNSNFLDYGPRNKIKIGKLINNNFVELFNE
ncbi:hypothetical protein MCEGEM12_01142 [Candidatus Pelagibacterales bacterium]